MRGVRMSVSVGVLFVLALACGDDDGKGADEDTAAGSDGGTASGDGGTGDGGSDDGPVLELLTDPCGGLGTPYVLRFRDDDNGVVGCGNGQGLWSTSDGGETFTRAHPSTNLYAYQVEFEGDGSMLLCGHDYQADDGALLMRGQGSDWQTLLRYGNNGSDPGAVYMSNCGTFAQPGSGRLVVASLTSGDITVSEDDGATWMREERYWEDDNLDGYSFYYLLQAVTSGGAWFGAGSKIDEPPVFFSASEDGRGDWWTMDATVIDSSIIGEVWALATPDGGATWLAGGRDQDQTGSASGFLYRSTDGGETWSGGKSVLAGLGGGELDIVHDIAFAPDGQLGVAVGHRYPPSTKGGFVIWTVDGGQNWRVLEEQTEILQSVHIAGERFWVAGDAFLARGELARLRGG